VFRVPDESRLPGKGEIYAVHGGDWVPPATEDLPASIAVRCRVCGTRLVATEEQVGSQIECPDCGTTATVPPPQEKPARPTPPAVSPDDIYPIYEGEGQPPPSDETVYGRYVAVVCCECRTRMLAREDQVGRRLICPDCGSATVVPPPQEKPAEAWSGPSEIYATCDDIGQPAPGSVAYQEHYPFKCPTCLTRLHATPDQAGREIACPDCAKPIRIPPPPNRPAPPDLADEPAMGDLLAETYDLGLPIKPPPVVVPGFRSAEDRPPRPPEALPQADVDAVPTSSGRLAPVRPPDRAKRRTWDGKRLGFLFDPGVRLCWLFSTVGLAAILALLGEASHLIAVADPRTYFIGMMYIAISGLLGLFGFVILAPYLLAILHDTAAGCDRIENWPDDVYHDWLLHGVNFVVPAALAVLAGEGLDRLLTPAGAPPWLGVGLAMFFLFPVLLLSVLETGSPFVPWSTPVWRSLVADWPAWILFYGAASIVVAVSGTVAWYGLARAGVWAVLPASGAVAAGVLLYVRLLGRLARHCARRTGDRDDDTTGRAHAQNSPHPETHEEDP
jgi:DNA-directed RNA polymerase subunit RPC12/RpoP